MPASWLRFCIAGLAAVGVGAVQSRLSNSPQVHGFARSRVGAVQAKPKRNPPNVRDLRTSFQRLQHVETSDTDDGLGPWRALPQEPAEGVRENLCTDGKLVPQLYVLGAPKSATSTLAGDLKRAGVSCVHGPYNDKEFHHFDGRFDWSYNGAEALEAQRQKWLEWMPDCPAGADGRTPSRVLLADFTPENLRLVPFAQETWGVFPPWNPNWVLGQQPAGGSNPVNLPPLLRRFYGEENSKRLRFVALLREPLARMQSAWYHSQSFNFTNECVDCRAPDFETAVREHLKAAKATPPVYSDWLYTGFYSAQLEEWVKYFEPSQLIVIPTLSLQHGDKDSVCRKISQDLEFSIDCNSDGRPMSHEWSHPHPPLEEDLPEDLRAEFNQWMRRRQDRLVEFLAQVQTEGAALADYTGKVGDKGDVAYWLQQGW